MALPTGSRVGVYQIAAPLGVGGMGEVYRARDTRLDRDVALKILPDLFASDPERLARFEREAKTLAALNHPHIAHIHGVEETGSTRALVMEFVDGEDLSQRIARGPIPLDEALSIARQIADALEAAHEQGIIHRDLKPANIKVRADGTVKVLDFGLAKAVDSVGTTETVLAQTRSGSLLGTPEYMSPEQARGEAVDKQTDIWAFGCVLFEMLTGHRAFGGTSAADVLAAVLHHEPEWSALPLDTPSRLHRILRRSLEKNRKRRLQDIGDARLELEDGEESVSTSTRAQRARSLSGATALIVIALAVGVAIGAAGAWRIATRLVRQSIPSATGRFTILLPTNEPIASVDQPAVALSPDGRWLAFVAGAQTSRLFVRNLNESQPKVVPHSEGAVAPFFSPDSRSIAFFADNRLKRVSVDGGDAVTVCSGAGNPRGGTWSPDGTIAFTPAPGSALFRVSADGGTPQPLTKLDSSRSEGAHHWAEFMPDGRAILYTVGAGSATSWDDREIVAESLVTGERHVVAQGSAARYLGSGHLVVARHGALSIVPFDAKTLRTTGTPVRIIEGVQQTAFGASQFTVSRSGTVVYLSGGITQRELVWMSRTGLATPIAAPPQTYWSVRVSPEGQRLALGVEGASYGVWVFDLVRGTMARQTFEGTSAYPIWTPDGARLTFNSTKSGSVLNLFWAPADGSGQDERLATSTAIQIPNSWSPDGRVLAYHEGGAGTGTDIWLLSANGDRRPEPFLNTRYDEGGAAFSPDGRWLAYVSTEAGVRNVFVQPFRGPGAKIQVSIDGGGGPVWSRNGQELFYRAGDRLFSVTVARGATTLTVSKPRPLFETKLGLVPFPTQAEYDVAAEGDRFVMIRLRGEQRPVTQLEIVLDATARATNVTAPAP